VWNNQSKSSGVSGDVLQEPVGDFGGVFEALEVGSGDFIVKGSLHGFLQERGFIAPAEKVEHHSSSKDRAERVRNSLPGDVGGRAVDGLEKRGASGMDVAGGGEAESAGEFGGQVADDVAEEIVGDDDVELAGIANEFHGESVDVEVAGFDVGIFGANGFEGALPEIAGEGHGVGFVGHAKTLEFVGAGIVKGEADNALDTFAGIDVLLSSDFLRSSLLEEAAGTDVDAFGIFPKDDEANIVASAIFQRGEALVEQFGGAGVDEEVELEAKTEENVGGVLVGGDAGIAESSKEDGVKFVAKHFDGAFGESDLFAKEFIGAPVEVNEFDVAAMFGGGLDGGDRDGSDFLADAVTGNDGDAGVGTAIAQRSVGHGGCPPGSTR